ncbi:hypothetical protein DFS34DRAFT_648296 [Phlyctochytrium arcticum]|nr:hypothetical protein DFS34DRAFT_648296 [Phlyctochytrium arcticum]
MTVPVTDTARYFRTALGDVTPNNINQFRAIHTSVLSPQQISNIVTRSEKVEKVVTNDASPAVPVKNKGAAGKKAPGKEEKTVETEEDKFWKSVVASGELAKLGYFNDVSAGSIVCVRDGTDKLQILSLCVLEAYRSLGLGSLLLDCIVSLCKPTTADSSTNQQSAPPTFPVKQIYIATPQDASARAFFEKRGFTESASEKGTLVKDL